MGQSLLSQDVAHRKDVSEVLKLISRRAYGQLGAKPMAVLPAIQAQRMAAGYPSTPAGAGMALCDVIAQQIDALQPNHGSEPQFEDRRWRPYLILKLCYLEGVPRDALASKLFIDRGTYNHEQARAIDMLAERIADLDNAKAAINITSSAVPTVVRRLPPLPPQQLLGRDQVLQHVIDRLIAGQKVAVYGLPGVGKSTLLSAVAHAPAIKNHFTGGVLWAALGMSGKPAAVLAEWALAMGVMPAHLGALNDVTALAQSVHVAIGEKRVLLVADDVWEIGTALALRVGGPSSAYLLSSRSPALAHDVAGDGALLLQELNAQDSLGMLFSFAPNVVQAFPDEATVLADACGGLPLSLALIGNRLRHVGHANQTRRIAREMAHLQDAAGRESLQLPELPLERQSGWPEQTHRTLDTVIGLSLSQVSEAAQSMLAALSVFPPKPSTFDETAAMLVGNAQEEVLDALVDAGLVMCDGASRYMLHQAIAEFGRTKLGQDVRPLQRLAEYYLAGDVPLDARDLGSALVAIDAASTTGANELLMRGTLKVAPYLERRGEYARALTLLKQAHDALAPSQLREQASLTLVMGLVHLKRGDYVSARLLLARSLAMARELNAPALVAEVLQYLAVIASDAAEYQTAQVHFDEALSIARNHGDVRREAELLFYMGVMCDQKSCYADAERFGQEGLAIAQRARLQEFVAAHVGGLGVLACKRGRLAEGMQQLQQALDQAEAVGFREGVSLFSFALGYAHASLQQLAPAKRHYLQGLSVAQTMGHSRSIVMLLAALGELSAREDDIVRGLAFCDEAVVIAHKMKHGHEISFALEQRASARTIAHNLDGAAADCHEAIKWAQRIQSPEREAFAWARLAGAYAAQHKLALASQAGFKSLSILRRIGFGVVQIAEYLARNGLRKLS